MDIYFCWPCFLTYHTHFSYFCSHPVTISAKLFKILISGFRGKLFDSIFTAISHDP